MEERDMFYYIVRGFLQMFISTFGVICNTVGMIVLTRPEMRSSFTYSSVQSVKVRGCY